MIVYNFAYNNNSNISQPSLRRSLLLIKLIDVPALDFGNV